MVVSIAFANQLDDNAMANELPGAYQGHFAPQSRNLWGAGSIPKLGTKPTSENPKKCVKESPIRTIHRGSPW